MKSKEIKSWVMIFNLVLASVAFAYLIGVDSVDAQQCGPNGCGIGAGAYVGDFNLGFGIGAGTSSTPVGTTGSGGGTPSIASGAGSAATGNLQDNFVNNGGQSAGFFNTGSNQLPSALDNSDQYQGFDWNGAGQERIPRADPSNIAPNGGVQGGGTERVPQIGGEGCPPGGCPQGQGGLQGSSPNYPGVENYGTPGGQGGVPGGAQAPQTPAQGLNNVFSKQNIGKYLGIIATATGIGATIGGLAGGKDGILWGSISGGAAGLTYTVLEGVMGLAPWKAGLISLGVGAAIFILTYKKESKEIVEFNCLPWQAPIGGSDCELCNDYDDCSEYVCKSLGQACDLVNKGEENEMCVWVNPHDVNSPIIKMVNVTEDHIILPAANIRPTSTGVEIRPKGKECIGAFTPLEFTFITKDEETGLGEPSQCKIDYNLSTSNSEDLRSGFDGLNYYVGGSSLFKYTHVETLALPGPSAFEAQNLTIENDGKYTLYIRCQDANGNFNQDAFSVQFCVEPGPDETPPLIVNTSIPSNSPIKFNQTSLDLEVYVNEPSDCKWDRTDTKYENMDNEMDCDQNVWDMNSQNVYTCNALLTGIEDRKTNEYYFRCKDKPYATDPATRIENSRSFLYKVIGTQPLNILEIKPSGTLSGATDVIPVEIEVTTDNGYNNGEAKCYYYVGDEEGREDGYIEFSETASNKHKQRQDLVAGEYKYDIKCLDLGGNAAYNETSFTVVSDRLGPLIVRVYKESGELKLITDEKSDCSYSFSDCNFEVDDGISMSSLDYKNHHSSWELNKNYYIRCKDQYNNQPNPNYCSIIVRPSDSEVISSGSSRVVEL